MILRHVACVLSIAFLAIALAGCAVNQNVKAQGAGFDWSGAAEKRVAVIQPDIHLGELTAGGLVEPRADWTKAAQADVAKQLGVYFAKRNTSVVLVNDLTDPREVQLAKLHGPVGRAIIRHAIMGVKLPNKTQAMDWTLGPDAALLRERYKTDYALFIYVNDTYTSAGRAFLMVSAAVFGVSVQGGQQIGFASLVDLRTGNVTWFNVRNDQGSGLRDSNGCKHFVEGILADLPK